MQKNWGLFSSLSLFIILTLSSSTQASSLSSKISSQRLPSISSYQQDLYLRNNNSLTNDSDTYQVGSEWGKKPITHSTIDHYSPAFRRAAFATARVGGGTSFYLGKFNNHFVMATNHHVMPTVRGCLGRNVIFPLLNLSFKCITYFGTWQSIDLTLFAIEVKTNEQEQILGTVAKNFNFVQDLTPGMPLITIGFGVANNPTRVLMGNQDSDCKVFSSTNQFQLMADPDDLNPGPYKAWSFANGCDISHGDSGSAMVDRNTGNVVGIIWTGKIPKAQKVRSSAYLDQLLQTNNPEIWTELSYAVPAQKMGVVLKEAIEKNEDLDIDSSDTLKALLGLNVN